ncbi:response regulator [Hansschlegelia beijingensis]|uniref:DNA-binding NtrC family response regulator n=1 Tax=Hansschlegelia beijingensis TaxID=1133344 RepID=A0A7W6GH20_9HYPH|nr:response regulator [Hansschlegelia beijingensis]MBB3974703.1 DNA-binding NtrC family response regulator [Hansschlegelia beijingensis]
MAPFRVLILEDDAILALDLATIVCCWTDADVTSCRSVAQARRALSGGFDFALLDVDVQDGKSYEFARSLKDRSLPFAFVSGSDADDAPDELRDAAFISKPYDQRAIERLVAANAGARRHP